MTAPLGGMVGASRRRAGRLLVAACALATLVSTPGMVTSAVVGDAASPSAAAPPTDPVTFPRPMAPQSSATTQVQPPPGSTMDPKYLRHSTTTQCTSIANPPLVLRRTKVTAQQVCAAPATQRSPIADEGYGKGRAPTAAWDTDGSPVQASLASAGILAGGPATYTSPDWGQQQPTSAPPARYGASMAYDSVHNVLVLFGGTDGHGVFYNDTWTFNGSIWTQLQPSPTPAVRAYSHMAWDAARGNVVLFGGYATTAGDYGDTWTWNGTAWTLQQPAASPHVRQDSAFAYDTAMSAVLLFGGGYQDSAGNHDLGDTWSWNGTTWTQLAPAAAPSARSAVRMAYDSARGVMLLFGGVAAGASVGFGDTWTFDGTNWTQQHPSQSPNARDDHMLAYDAGLNGVQLFGGYAWDSAGNPVSISNDTWLWNGTNWLLANGIASPPARMTAAMAYDDAMSGLVLFGGYSGNTLGDTWSYITGTNSAPVIPSVSVTTDRGTNPYGRGDIATYTITAGNAGTSVITNGSVADTLGAGQRLAPIPLKITDTGTGGTIACTGQVTCTTTATSVSITGLTIPAGDSLTVAYSTIAVGTERMCSSTSDAATATSATGTHSPVSTALLVCDVGLGSQSWWYYTTAQPVAALSAVAVNMANGNAVITAQDGTPIPGHGSLSFGLERTYNSEESGAQTLRAALARGWLLTVGQSGTGAGQTGVSGLYVPTQESVSASLPVDLVDSTGTRLMFTPQALSAPVDATALTPSVGSLGPVAPRMLALETSPDPSHPYTRICVDQSFTAPPGAHLSLWRYIELASGSSPCVPAAGSTPAVLGFAAERTDRMRYEFARDGHLLDLQDGNGNELRYTYDPPASAGQPLGMLRTVVEPASGRTLHLDPETGDTKVTDPAGRVTRYYVDGASHLTRVVNPDGSSVSYTYGPASCSGASADQLCSVTDARGSKSAFTYSSTSPQGGPYAGPPRLSSFVDPAGTTTTYTLNTSPDSATVDTLGRRTFLPSFDDTGRPGYVYQGTTNGTWSHVTDYRWDVSDPSLRPCRQPDYAPDNNLCHISRLSLDGQANGDDTSYVYDQEGQPLVTARCVAKQDPGPGQTIGSCGSAQRITTNGRRAQYVEVGGSVLTYTDTVAGRGGVTSQSGTGPSGRRGDSGTLFVLSDLAQSLTPQGNAVASGYTQFLTSYVLDTVTTVAANQRPPAPPCADPQNIRSNSGARCEADGPSYDGAHTSIGQWSYNPDGTMATHTTPLAIAKQPVGQNPTVVTYTYYADSDKDLSGTTSAGGWVKGVTDQMGNFVAVAYDAAGNPVRTWDRDATMGTILAAYPGTIASPPSPAYSEKLYGPAGSAAAYSSPWRYVLAQRDPMGNLLTDTVDQNGDRLTIRPPLGNQQNTSAYDTVQTYDSRGLVLTAQHPEEAIQGMQPWRYTYDGFGSRVAQQDPSNVVTTYQYDVLGRPIVTKFTRGPSNTGPTPAACRDSQQLDSPIPLGRVVCSTSQTFDGVDNIISTTDANAQVTSFTYDGLRQRLTVVTPRNDGTYTKLTSATVYDIDGNVADECPPNEFTVGVGSCTPTAPYSKHHTYDALDRLASTTTYQTVGGAANTAGYQYDADGNLAAQTDANGHTTKFDYNLLDRRVTQAVPHDTTSNVTTWTYSPSGDVLTVLAPGNGRTTAYSYDADHRVLDSVTAADNAVASKAGTGGVYDFGAYNIRTRKMYDADGHVVAQFSPRAFGPTAAAADPSGAWKFLPDATFMTRTDYDHDGRPVATYSPRYGGGAVPDQAGSIQSVQCPTNPSPQPVANVPAYPGGVGVCVTHKQYDAAGNVSRMTLPTSGGNDDRYVQYAYTDDRLLYSVQTPNPQPGGARVVASTYAYDGVGRKVLTQDAGSHQQTSSYTSDGRLASSTDPGGHTTNYTYDANGNQVSVQDPMQLISTTAYYTDNLRRSSTDPAGDTTSYTYDQVGNVLQTFSPSANAKEANNTAGKATANTYFADNLLKTVTTPVSPDGNLVRVTTYQYDAAGRKVSRNVAQVQLQFNPPVTSDGGTEQFTYYPDDRQWQQLGLSMNDRITNSYDADGNPISVTDSTSGSTISASFYADDLAARVDDGNATTVETYDALRNPDLVQQTVDGRGAQYPMHYAYSDAGMVTRMDALAGSPSGIAATTWSYDNQGRPTSELRPGGSKVVWDYNADNTVGDIKLFNPSGTQTGTWTYQFDNDRRQVSGSVSLSAGATSQTARWDIAYDPAGRIKTFDDHSDPVETTTWNRNGDRLSWTTPKGTTTATYNANDSMATMQVGSAPAVSYTYMPFGETSNDGCLTYGFDGFERLNTSTLSPQPGAVCTGVVGGKYTHDGLDRMRTDTEGSATTTVLDYIGMGQAVGIETVTSTPMPTDTYYALSPNGERIGLTRTTATGNMPEQLFDNGFGTINLSAQPDGTATCAAIFDPFGQPLKTGTSVNPCSYGSTSNDFFYRGGRFTVSAQGYQFGSRTYQPGIGSFLEPDVYRSSVNSGADLGLQTDPLTRNLYGYGGGDPVNRWDPSGHCPDGDCSKAGDPQLYASLAAQKQQQQEADQENANASMPLGPTSHKGDWNPPGPLKVVPQEVQLQLPGKDYYVHINAYSGHCYDCDGATFNKDGRTYAWSDVQNTFVCGQHDAAASSCGEDHTYAWEGGNKFVEYDDGVRTGIHAAMSTVASLAAGVLVTVGCGVATGGMGSVGCIVAGSAAAGAVSGYMDCGWKCAAQGALVGAASGAAGFGVAKLASAGVEAVQGLRAARQAYVSAARGIAESGAESLAAGQDPEAVARWAVDARNALKVQGRASLPSPVRKVLEWRSTKLYDNSVGPSYEYLAGSGRSAEQIVASAGRTNAWINRLLGVT